MRVHATGDIVFYVVPEHFEAGILYGVSEKFSSLQKILVSVFSSGAMRLFRKVIFCRMRNFMNY
jgi:hypothetical protein